MKTTLEIPDELMREIKIRAARDDRKLKDLVAELLRKGMAAEEEKPGKVHNRVQFPFVQGTPAPPGQELTAERLAEILLEEDIQEAARGATWD